MVRASRLVAAVNLKFKGGRERVAVTSLLSPPLGQLWVGSPGGAMGASRCPLCSPAQNRACL